MATSSLPADPRRLNGLEVCIVGVNYAPESTGIAPYTTAVAVALRDAGSRVKVVTGLPHYPQWRVDDPRYKRGTSWRSSEDGIEILRVRHHVPPGAGLLGRARMEADFLRRSLPAIRSADSQIIIAVTPSLSGAAAAAIGARGRPVGIIVQDLTGVGAAETGTAGRLVSSLIHRTELATLKRASLIGVITPRFEQILVENGVDRSRVVDLPNFTHITPSPLSKTEARSRLGWPTDTTLVVHTGNMGRKQGLASVIESARTALRRKESLNFMLVGDGNQRALLEAQAADLPNVAFVDPLSNEEYPLALAAADVLLLNELGGVSEMCMPSKLTSYVVANRPIIAAVEPEGITGQTLLRGDVAELVRPSDPLALLAAIDRVTTNQDLSKQLASAAKHFGATHYTAQAAAARYRSFAARLLRA
jgi:Glycosyltransferase